MMLLPHQIIGASAACPTRLIIVKERRYAYSAGHFIQYRSVAADTEVHRSNSAQCFVEISPLKGEAVEVHYMIQLIDTHKQGSQPAILRCTTPHLHLKYLQLTPALSSNL